MIELEIHEVPLTSIIVTDRQRSALDPAAVEALAESIHRRGLIHTILVERETSRLIAGENRLAAFRILYERHGEKYATIPARYAKDVTHDELVALELEENIRRSPLEWKDEARTVAAYHDVMCRIHGDGWRLEDTGTSISLSPSAISRYITVARELAAGNKLVLEATGLAAAYNAITRARDRAINRELSNLILTPSGLERKSADADEDGWNDATTGALEYPLLNGDFITWATTYAGPRFNFVHCDFPYGIGWDSAKKGNSSSFTRSDEQSYSDSFDVYEALIRALGENRARLFEPETHIMFWLSARYDYHERTRALLAEVLPDARIDPCPLVWHRADSSGVLVDAARGGRRTYETALQITLGDRKIVKAVDMSFAHPSERAERHHISQKPDAVLRHFFRMYVDEDTAVLDPTCGFGGALRTAEHLGARSVFGIELNEEIAADARRECLTFRAFRKL